ncbi:MAG: hypothetical protein LBC51_03445 [Treponema sp.]|nr:hypothetical protein [Treponema sp.]
MDGENLTWRSASLSNAYELAGTHGLWTLLNAVREELKTRFPDAGGTLR